MKSLINFTSQGEEETLKQKIYGKQIVYVVDQAKFPAISQEERRALEKVVNGLKEDVRIRNGEIVQKESNLKVLLSSDTTDDALQQIQQLSSENSVLEEKLKSLEENTIVISDEERKMILAQRQKCLLEWRKRRRLAKDVLDAILEGYPKTRNDLYEEIGIETDEATGVRMPE